WRLQGDPGPPAAEEGRGEVGGLRGGSAPEGGDRCTAGEDEDGESKATRGRGLHFLCAEGQGQHQATTRAGGPEGEAEAPGRGGALRRPVFRRPVAGAARPHLCHDRGAGGLARSVPRQHGLLSGEDRRQAAAPLPARRGEQADGPAPGHPEGQRQGRPHVRRAPAREPLQRQDGQHGRA
ncbi:unnamed protein product, partial [Prorocentrum cordatum]